MIDAEGQDTQIALNRQEQVAIVYLSGYAVGAGVLEAGLVSKETFCSLLSKLGVEHPEQYYDGVMEKRA